MSPDIHRQMLLCVAAGVLVPGAVGHALRPGSAARMIRVHGVLPGASGSAARAYGTALVGAELIVTGEIVYGLARPESRVPGVALAVLGAALGAYVVALLRRGYHGECGCMPIGSEVSRLTLLPAGTMLAAGLLLAIGPSPLAGADGFARSAGVDETALALVLAVVTGLALAAWSVSHEGGKETSPPSEPPILGAPADRQSRIGLRTNDTFSEPVPVRRQEAR